MEYMEYKKAQLELTKLLLKFQGDYNVEEKWLMRMLIEEAQNYAKVTVRFNDKE